MCPIADQGSSGTLDLTQFRLSFPVLARRVWLDTAAAPPAAAAVLGALRDALAEWDTGDFSWVEWEQCAIRTRNQMARMLGVPETTVALATSLAQAASLIAGSVTGGRIVVSGLEFRSNLFPWLALRRRGVDVVEAGGARGESSPLAGGTEPDHRADTLLEAITPGTTLVAVSEMVTARGNRIDLAAIADRCREVGSRLFVNLTQTLGALRYDARRIDADYVAVHGYKWLLCPRGCAWLHVRADRVVELQPQSPSWRSVEDPYPQIFGGPMELAADARALDASLSWLPWIGAEAALKLLLSLDHAAVEQRALELAGAFRDEAAALGHLPLEVERPSQVVVVRTRNIDDLEDRLHRAGIRALAQGDRLRVAFHGFNDESDLSTVLNAIKERRG
jgi:selenocysteine lyase/cysteine desulfurase